MRICLIGKNLTNLVLAYNLASKNLNVDIFFDKKNQIKFSQRTIGISKNNFDFLLKMHKQSKIIAWPIKNIKIYNEKNNFKELFEFKNKNTENFFLVKHSNIFNSFYKICSKNKNIKFKIIKNSTNLDSIINDKKYSIIINSETNNQLTKKYFNLKVEKNYDSIAYTGIIDHKKIKNNQATQIFTKYGPLAFLPISNSKTSVVFSIFKKFKLEDIKIFELIKKYNLIYKIKKKNKLEKFTLKYLMLKNYTYKNILCFGDLLHKIHPLAGQGFNMNIRDIKTLSTLIDEKIELGLQLDESLLHDFQYKTKHLNYLFGTGIDFIHEFFQLDNKSNNLLSESAFNILKKNKLFNKYATLVADTGLKF